MEELYILFVQQLDAIYYTGYADQIAKENPELFTFEWREFLRNHPPPPKVIKGNFKRPEAKVVKHPASIKISQQRA